MKTPPLKLIPGEGSFQGNPTDRILIEDSHWGLKLQQPVNGTGRTQSRLQAAAFLRPKHPTLKHPTPKNPKAREPTWEATGQSIPLQPPPPTQQWRPQPAQPRQSQGPAWPRSEEKQSALIESKCCDSKVSNDFGVLCLWESEVWCCWYLEGLHAKRRPSLLHISFHSIRLQYTTLQEPDTLGQNFHVVTV
jgi:hypothetical protein